VAAVAEGFAKAKGDILAALQDDLNTPEALSYLHECLDQFSVINASRLDLPAVEDFAKFIDDVLGIKILIKDNLESKQQALISERQAARQAKNWEKSDELRRQLASDGVGVRDNDSGTTIWYRL
jgi:cysteinyl-tRNA synthetase